MGLDMFLTARRHLRSFVESDLDKTNAINAMFDIEPVTADSYDDIKVSSISFEAAYWRKANAIHIWFVDECQDGVDDCKEYYVTRQQLFDLLELCIEVRDNRDKASELLPTRSGFFFGGTEYDRWYFDSIKYTIDRLEKLLNSPQFENMTFYYGSSW